MAVWRGQRPPPKEKLRVLPSAPEDPLLPPPYGTAMGVRRREPPEEEEEGAGGGGDEGEVEITPPASLKEGEEGVLKEKRDRKKPDRFGDTNIQMPIREVPDPLALNRGGTMFVYAPFTTSDLYNWKQFNPPFEEDPGPLLSLMENVRLTHYPTWDDTQMLLNTCFLNQKPNILSGARSQYMEEHPQDTAAQLGAALPAARPPWGVATPEDRDRHSTYFRFILAGMKKAARKAPNLQKVLVLKQGKDEPPAAFLQRLKEAFGKYTDINLEDPNNVRVLTTQFVGNSCQDIRRKLQKVEGGLAADLGVLVEVAQRVFERREEEEEKQSVKRQAKFIAAVFDEKEKKGGQGQGQSQGRKGGRKGPPLRKDQCAFCKEDGHWRRDCPKLQAKEGRKKGEEREGAYNVREEEGGEE